MSDFGDTDNYVWKKKNIYSSVVIMTCINNKHLIFSSYILARSCSHKIALKTKIILTPFFTYEIADRHVYV